MTTVAETSAAETNEAIAIGATRTQGVTVLEEIVTEKTTVATVASEVIETGAAVMVADMVTSAGAADEMEVSEVDAIEAVSRKKSLLCLTSSASLRPI